MFACQKRGAPEDGRLRGGTGKVSMLGLGGEGGVDIPGDVTEDGVVADDGEAQGDVGVTQVGEL